MVSVEAMWGAVNKASLLLEYQEAKEKPKLPPLPDSNKAVPHLPYQHTVREVLPKWRFK